LGIGRDDFMAKNKQTGKTEVYPFWSMDDIKNMMDYFKMKEMWHWYWIFNAGLLDLTSRQNGSVGGYMVKKMIEQQEKQD